MSARLSGTLTYGALVLAAVAFFRGVLLGHEVIPWDIRTYTLPHAVFVSQALRDGELPLWNPFIYCGHPFAANVQTALYYPPRLLATLLGGVTARSLLYSLELELVCHVALAGVFCFWLMQELGIRRMAALAGALSFEIGSFFASQAEHLGAIEGMAWLPLIWLLIFRSARTWTLRRGALLSAALAMTVLCGFTPVTAVVHLSTFFLVLLLIATSCASGRLLIQFALCCLTSALLCAVLLAPAAELTLLSVSRYRSDWIGNGGGLPLRSLLSLLWPDSGRRPISGETDVTLRYLYSGVVMVAGALVFLTRRKPVWSVAVIVLLLISALFLLGDSTPFGLVYGRVVPAFLRGSIYPQYWIGPFSLALCIAGAVGVSGLAGKRWLSASILALAIVDLMWSGSGRPFNSADPVAEPGVSETAFAGSSVLLARAKALAGLTVPPSRLDTVDDSLDWVGSATITQLPTAGGEDPMALIRTMQARLAFAAGQRWGYYYQVTDVASPLLSALNICCLLTRARLPVGQVTSSAYTKEIEVPGGYLYFNERALPRFYVVHQVAHAANGKESASWLHRPAWQPRVEAVIEGTIHAPESLRPGDPEDWVRVERYRRNSVTVATRSERRSVLVSSEAHYPGWRAFVDGKAVPIFYTNAAFRGIELPAGTHQVRFEFVPVLVFVSFLVSLVSWTSVFWVLWRERGRRVRRQIFSSGGV